MAYNRLCSTLVVFLLITSICAQVVYSTKNNRDGSTIQRDVVVIGGGSSGVYSAIRLKALGKSVAVIEKQDILGGHTQTYIDPNTGGYINCGVEIWHNISVAIKYLEYLNVPLTLVRPSANNASQVYVNFQTNQGVNYTQPNSTTALEEYYSILSQYPYLDDGFFLPNPVPEDLTMSFGEFVSKYNLGSSAFLLYFYGEGLGNVLDRTAIYMFKNFGRQAILGLASGFLADANGDNHQLYDNALGILGPDVFLNSTVQWTKRNDSYVQVEIQTPSGPQNIIADQMIISIPPKLDNLQGFDLSSQEQQLFGQFNNSAYYTVVINDTGIAANTAITNVNPSAPYDIPAEPAIYSYQPTQIPGFSTSTFGSPYSLSDEAVQSAFLSALHNLQVDGFANISLPNIVAYSSHTPFALAVSPTAIENGFYNQLNGLQGQRNTYYTGAAFQTQDSALIWNFTEANIIPRMVPGASSWTS